MDVDRVGAVEKLVVRIWTLGTNYVVVERQRFVGSMDRKLSLWPIESHGSHNRALVLSILDIPQVAGNPIDSLAPPLRTYVSSATMVWVGKVSMENYRGRVVHESITDGVPLVMCSVLTGELPND